MSAPDTRAARLNWVALASALVPLAVANVCYLVSATAGHIPLCVPYVEGCTSISASGRYGMAYWLFKAGMLPSAGLLALFWVLCYRWLRSLADPRRRTDTVILWLGVTSAAFLVLYTVFLGSKGDFYNLMRRYGVTVYYSFGFLAQLILLQRLRRLTQQGTLRLPPWLLRTKTGVLLSLLIMGLVSIPVSNFWIEKDIVENVLEWNFSWVLVSYYVLTWRAWQICGYDARLGHAGPR